MRAGKPIWTTSSFLIYTGGMTVLGAGIGALGYLSSSNGSGAMAGWALLVLVVLYGLAHDFRRRDRPVAAGIFAFVSVIAWGAFVGLTWRWFGWLGTTSSSFKHFSVARLSLELLILIAARDDRRRFGFPFITLISALVGWFFVVDLITSGGSWTAFVTLVIGLVYLIAGWVSDKPSAFWLHLVGGALIGGSFIYWWHTSDAQWALISIVSLVYVLLASATKRSSWAVLGTIGFFAATIHYVVGSPLAVVRQGVAGWAPSVAFACLGFWLVLLGLRGRHNVE
jgi:hypothetical protein